MPFEPVDAVLSETGTVQRRLRDLPSRVGVSVLLAMHLFPEIGYRLVWDKLTAGLWGTPIVCPSTKALVSPRAATPVSALGTTPGAPLTRACPTPPSLHRRPPVTFRKSPLVAFEPFFPAHPVRAALLFGPWTVRRPAGLHEDNLTPHSATARPLSANMTKRTSCPRSGPLH